MSVTVPPTLPWTGEAFDSCTTSTVTRCQAGPPTCSTSTEPTPASLSDQATTEARVVWTHLMWLSKERIEIPSAQPLEEELQVWCRDTRHVIVVPQNWTWDELRRGHAQNRGTRVARF